MTDCPIGARVRVDMPGQKFHLMFGVVVRKPSRLLSEVRVNMPDGTKPIRMIPNARLKKAD